MIWKLINYLKKKNIDFKNNRKKNIKNYRSISFDELFENSSSASNFVVSGASKDERNAAIMAYITMIKKYNIPVILLHNYNLELEDEILANYSNSILFSRRNLGQIQNQANYDPFIENDSSVISKILSDVGKKDFNLSSSISLYFEGMAKYLMIAKRNPSLPAFFKCPHGRLVSKVQSAVNQGQISPQVGQDLQFYLASGGKELGNIKIFLNNLSIEMSPILSNRLSKKQESLRSAYNKGYEVISVDLLSSSESLYTRLLLSELNELYKYGGFAVVIDDISLTKGEVLTEILSKPKPNTSFMIGESDFFSACANDVQIYESVLGLCHNYLLFNHSSGISRTKWAEFFGKYDKTKISESSSSGHNIHKWSQIIPGFNSTNTFTYSEDKDYILSPEDIKKLNRGEFYFFDGYKSRLVKGCAANIIPHQTV